MSRRYRAPVRNKLTKMPHLFTTNPLGFLGAQNGRKVPELSATKQEAEKPKSVSTERYVPKVYNCTTCEERVRYISNFIF